MIDIRATRESYANNEIHDAGWPYSDANLADGLTMFSLSHYFEHFSNIGLLSPAVYQWVARLNRRTDSPRLTTTLENNTTTSTGLASDNNTTSDNPS